LTKSLERRRFLWYYVTYNGSKSIVGVKHLKNVLHQLF